MPESMVHLKIDGKGVEVPKGSTILDAARKLDIDVPTLCHLNLEGTPFRISLHTRFNSMKST